MDTLKFIEASYVQTNENSVHIAWTMILLHTRELQQPLYQWQASFDPLTRKYEQFKGNGLSNPELRKIKILIAKQITDDEKVILTGLDATFTIENVDKGSFILRAFQRKLAENASRFQSKKYRPDARILTYLRVRAQEFKVALPLFMAKKKLEKGKRRSLRRKDNAVMCNTIDIAFTRLMSCNPLSILHRFLLSPRVDTPAPAQAPLEKVAIKEKESLLPKEKESLL